MSQEIEMSEDKAMSNVIEEQPVAEPALQPLTETEQAMAFFNKAMKQMNQLYPNVMINPRVTMDFSLKPTKE